MADIRYGFFVSIGVTFLKGEEGNESIVSGNDGCLVCLGGGCDIRALSSGKGLPGIDTRQKQKQTRIWDLNPKRE